MNLSLAMIVKDEQENLDVCLASVEKYVDEIVIVDTGSSDDTTQVAERHGAKVTLFTPETNPEAFFVDNEATCQAFTAPGAYSGEAMLGDFGAARRASFARATGDFILWLDADDVLEGAECLPSFIEQMRANNLDMGFVAYDYARDHLGRTFYRQWRERILRRDCASWVNAVHEVLMPLRPISSFRFEGLTVAHRRKADRKTTPHRNYKILLRQWQQEKQSGTAHDPRTLFYLGQEARWVQPDRAVDFYEQYLRISGWSEERAAAHMAQGHIYEFGQLPVDVGDAYARADREYATAAAEMPSNPDGLFGLARIAYLRQRWQDCIDYSNRAFALGNAESMLGANPMDRLYRPHVYYNHALSKVGRLEEALASCKTALAVCPDDPGIPGGAPGMLLHNLKCYESELALRKEAERQKEQTITEEPKALLNFDKNEDIEQPAVPGIPPDALVIWAMQLWKQTRGDEKRELAILDGLPPHVAVDPVVTRMRASTERRFKAGFLPQPYPVVLTSSGEIHKLSIVLWTGPAPEPWDATTPNGKGLGGSETAAIEMATHLAALGHKVVIYGDPPNAHTHSGVLYERHESFRGATCDVFISSRAPWAIDQFGPVNAKLKLLWVHDIHCGPTSPQMERWLLKFDRVMCLSQWHKKFFLGMYPTLDYRRVLVTRNGIDPARFGQQHIFPAKDNSLVFSSSPNRGLDLLLANFPLIRAQVPDAQLHIYYGFDTWETFAKAHNATNELAEIERYKKLIEASVARGDSQWHGKRPQSEVAAAYMRAKVWPYLTSFTETYCITALEAQAAGCVPVCSTVGALPETVKHGVLVDVGDWSRDGQFHPRQEGPQEWLNAVVRCLTVESYRIPIALAGRQWALDNTSWQALAADWERMFRELMADTVINPLPRYVGSI